MSPLLSTLDPVTSPAAIAGAAFDRIAETYDSEFTNSLIGRAQRNIVWKALLQTFHEHEHILELNCGTGEDAIFLARHGITVLACDTSPGMIAKAAHRLQHESAPLPVEFRHLPTECLATLDPHHRFDGAFSNFSGLNCVADLDAVASSLSQLTSDRARLLLCVSTRFCIVEILFYLLQRYPRKALRRSSGHAKALLLGAELDIHYPRIRQIQRSFAPHFRLLSITGVGVAIPPSYLEPWARRHPRCLRLLSRIDPFLRSLPVLRATGDHVLLCFEKVAP